ncbi:MAG: ATP-binding protein [Burkholderiales bacterium]
MDLSPSVPRSRPQPTDGSHQNLRRLLQLRWVAIAGQSVTIAGVCYGLDLALPIGPLAAIVAVLALWNAFSWRRLGSGERVGSVELLLQIIVDVVAFSGLLYFSGGSTNPFVSLYLLPLMIAATLLHPGYTWAVAALAVACYTLLMFWYVPLPIDHEHGSGFSLHILGMWLNFVLSAGLIAGFVVQMALSIRARDQRLAEARERALRDEQVVALGAMAAGAAHELGTPLSTIAVLARELEVECPGSAQQEDLRVLRDQVDQCKRIISDLLTATGRSRAEDAHSQPIDAFVQGIVEQWRGMRPGASLRLRLDGATPPPMIAAEKTLSQAFVSLLNNAFDASPAGIELDGSWTEERMTLEIRDRGSGLDPATARRVGEPFFSTKAHNGGRGLGVFLARAAIERFGGELDLRNRDGGGAATRIVLPLRVLLTGTTP